MYFDNYFNIKRRGSQSISAAYRIRFRVTFTNSHRRKRFPELKARNRTNPSYKTSRRIGINFVWVDTSLGRFTRRGWRSKSRNPEFDFRHDHTRWMKPRPAGPGMRAQVARPRLENVWDYEKKRAKADCVSQADGRRLSLAKPTTFVHVAPPPLPPPPLPLLCERMLRARWSVHGRW